MHTKAWRVHAPGTSQLGLKWLQMTPLWFPANTSAIKPQAFNTKQAKYQPQEWVKVLTLSNRESPFLHLKSSSYRGLKAQQAYDQPNPPFSNSPPECFTLHLTADIISQISCCLTRILTEFWRGWGRKSSLSKTSISSNGLGLIKKAFFSHSFSSLLSCACYSWQS